MDTALTTTAPADLWLAATGEELTKELTVIPPDMAADLNELAAEAHGLEVTDEADTAGMAEARRLRLAIRTEILRPICDDVTGFDLAGMTTDAFDRLRAGLQAAHDQAERERAEAEAARIAAAEADRINRDLMREENERLRVENERQRAEAAAQQAETERLATELRAREHAEANRLAAELRAKQDAEAAAARAAREAERLAASADDVEKMRALYQAIQAIHVPELSGVYAAIAANVATRLGDTRAYITEQMRRATR